MVIFAMVEVDNFCKKKLIGMLFKLSDGKYARFFVSKSERQTILSHWIFNDIAIVMSKKVSFDFVDPISTLGFGSGVCVQLLV